MAFAWAEPYPDLKFICRAFGLYELDNVMRHYYKPLTGIIQDGPQCGLVALAMCTSNSGKVTVEKIFESAKKLGLTNNGEIFSVNAMATLAKKFLRNNVEILNESLDSVKVTEFLLNRGILLVPYDCDKNHTPVLLRGHKAHWAAISGVLETDGEVHVIAKHGKSLNPTIWKLSELARSNEQLFEFSPDRQKGNLVYVVPDGGLAGPDGLCGRSVLIHPFYEPDLL